MNIQQIKKPQNEQKILPQRAQNLLKILDELGEFNNSIRNKLITELKANQKLDHISININQQPYN
ncbi:MAG: hypothetical protein LW595_04605 [Rickettsiales bacterium]|jgi:hypothetical protein|nr:hypothetical protein [Rickettsiales bacterium]